MNRNGRFSFIVLILCFFSMPAWAQTKETEHFQQAWTCFYDQTRLTSRWGIWFDGQYYRRENFFTNTALAEWRPGIIYYFNGGNRMVAGYDHTDNYPSLTNQSFKYLDQKIWEQFQWYTKYQRISFTNYIRLEQRYTQNYSGDTLMPGTTFTNRIRIFNYMFIPLSMNKNSKLSKFYFACFNELFLNFGKNIVYNYFDQDLLFIAGKYEIDKLTSIHLGYLKGFQELASANKYKNTNAIRLAIYKDFDFRRDK